MEQEARIELSVWTFFKHTAPIALCMPARENIPQEVLNIDAISAAATCSRNARRIFYRLEFEP